MKCDVTGREPTASPSFFEIFRSASRNRDLGFKCNCLVRCVLYLEPMSVFFGANSMWLCFDLVDGGYISSDQAMQVLNKQMSCRTPIGQLAVENEMMSMGQVFDVLAQQPRSSLPFGELAIEMGYLTRLQLGELILAQLDRVPSLSELLVNLEIISKEELGKAIEARRQQRAGSPQEQQFELLGMP